MSKPTTQSNDQVVSSAGLPSMEVPTRLPAARNKLSEHKCEALIVHSLSNICYLTGFSGSAAMLAIGPEKVVLTTDGRYAEQVQEELQASSAKSQVDEVVIGGLQDQRKAIAAAVAPARTVGVESAFATWDDVRLWQEALPEVDLVAVSGLVESLRIVKDQGELARMRLAAFIADRALEKVLAEMLPLPGEPGGTRATAKDSLSWPTEAEVALELDHQMRLLGASGPSFDTIVASGPNAAKPHAKPSNRPIAPGELVVVDYGATFEGYRSDTTRTVWWGEAPSEKAREVLAAVLESQAAGVAALRPGIEAREVDAVCRESLKRAGLLEYFNHGTGHGVGLDIHEDPPVAPRCSTVLLPGMVVTVEPGVYLPGLLGVRIEDTLVVTESGCDPLTKVAKQAVSAQED